MRGLQSLPGRLVKALALLAILAVSIGCGGAEVKLATDLRPPPAGLDLDPPPPDSVVWIRIGSGTVPDQTLDGTSWDEDGLPDPYAVIYRRDKELLRTEQAKDTLSPEWTNPGANFEVKPGMELKVRLVDADGLNDKLIGQSTFPAPTRADVAAGQLEWAITERIKISLEIEQAHAMFGLGFDFELRRGVCYVTAVFKHGPAGRAGLRKGDKIHSVGGRKVAKMSYAELKSAFNSIGIKGLRMVVLHEEVTTDTVVLAEGPVYALVDELAKIN